MCERAGKLCRYNTDDVCFPGPIYEHILDFLGYDLPYEAVELDFLNKHEKLGFSYEVDEPAKLGDGMVTWEEFFNLVMSRAKARLFNALPKDYFEWTSTALWLPVLE